MRIYREQRSKVSGILIWRTVPLGLHPPVEARCFAKKLMIWIPVSLAPYGSFAKSGSPNIEPNILYSLLWGSPKCTPNFRKHPYRLSDRCLSAWYFHVWGRGLGLRFRDAWESSGDLETDFFSGASIVGGVIIGDFSEMWVNYFLRFVRKQIACSSHTSILKHWSLPGSTPKT